MSGVPVFVSWPGYDPDDAATGRRLVEAGHRLVLEPKLGARSPDDLVRLARECHAAIVSTDPFTAEVLAALDELRVIARVGVGVDSIDRDAADRRGVAITITPDMNAETVADHTLALILAATRKVAAQDASVRAGGWDRVGPLTPGELPGKTVGLVGAGAIGRAVAARLRGFGVAIVFVDERVDALPGARRLDDLDALLAIADIVTLHAPLTEATRHLIDAHALARMKPCSLLVNTARGGLVDQAAVFEALRAGHLGAAALDVFEVEPPDPAAFEGIPNLVLSPHLGGLSHESIARMTASATDSVLAVLSGRLPETAINAAALATKERS
ncbi:MAG: phosphoglycerate dehydrogenase [Azospirillaceae bacterium]